MPPSPRRKSACRLVLAASLLAAIALTPDARVAAGPESALRSAWQRATDAQSYAFATRFTQRDFPAPRIGNAGRHPKEHSLYLEGEVGGGGETLRLWLWDGAAGVAGGEYDRRSALALKVEDGRTFTRRESGAWEPIVAASSLFAPGGDAAAFLEAARGSRRVDRTRRSLPGHDTIVFDHYRFSVDDAALTRRLRGQLDREMAARGRLPAGLTPQMAGLFAGAIGQGQAWVDGQGFPARIQMDFEWPARAGGERRTVSITTDFKAFEGSGSVPAFAADPAGWLRVTLGRARAEVDWGGLGEGLALAVAGLAGLLLAWQLRRRDAYGRVALILAVAVVVPPVATVVEARERIRSREALAWAMAVRRDPELAPPAPVPEAPAVTDGVAGTVASDAPPEADAPDAPRALAQAIGGDRDRDGLSDTEETELCRDLPATAAICPSADKADTDGDGLTDGQEYKHLGTDVNAADSDGDGLGDGVEVRGFGGAFSDPLQPDTDRDGRPDGEECPSMATGACPDTDGDGSPDLFDDDSDGDGFFDTIDYAPRHRTEVLTADQPLALAVERLEAGRTVFVDVQVAPTARNRLGRVASVLDWPTGDSQGQVQRRLDGSFADALGADGGGTEEAGGLDGGGAPSDAYGDMRLLPMLEIEMAGAGAPLPRRPAEAVFPLDAYQQMAAVQLIDDEKGERTRVYIQALDPTPGRRHTMRLLGGTCQARGALVHDFGTLVAGTAGTLPGRLAKYADGAHVLVVGDDGGEEQCLPVVALLKGTIALSHSFMRTPRRLGTATLAQRADGAGLRLDLAAGGAYAGQLIAGTCDRRGGVQLDLGALANGTPALLPGQFVVDLADRRHALVLRQEGREVLCATLPNVVNGPASEREQIDDRALLPHGVSVQETGTDGRLVARVPLSPVADEASGRAAGLGGRMVFVAGAAARIDATARLVWLVQALTDMCGDPPVDFMPGAAEQARLKAWCAEHGAVNQAQIVHRYTDDWRLAGLRVREDRGLEVATMYEKPTAPPAGGANRATGPSPELFLLATSLQRRFVSGLDCGLATKASVCAPDGQRDVTVAAMPALYDRDAPAPPGHARLGLQNIEVWRDSAATHAELQPLLHGRVPQLLRSEFGGPGAPAAPLLLFAREETFRTLPYGSPGYGDGGSGGRQVRLDFAPAGRPAIQPVVVAALSWMPYRHDAAADTWEPYPFDEYWDLLSADLKQAFPAGPDEDAELEAAGRAALAQLVYAQLYLGQSHVVAAENRPTWTVGEGTVVNGYSDEDLAEKSAAARNDAGVISNGGLTRLVIEPLGNELGADVDFYYRHGAPLLRSQGIKPPPLRKAFFTLLGDVVKRTKDNIVTSYVKHRGNDRWMARKGAMGAAIAIGIVGGIGSYVVAQTNGPPAAAQVMAGMTLAYTIADTANSLYQALKPAKDAAGFVKSASTSGSVAALVLTELVAWGVLIYRIADAGILFASLEMNKIVADAAGGTVVAIALFTLALAHPVGAVISAVIGLIDAAINLACGFLDRAQRASTAGEIICQGLTGWMAKGVAYVIYSQSDMVTISDPFRTHVLDLRTALMDPDRGLVPDQALQVSLDLRNTLGLIAVPSNLGALYWHQYTPETLRAASFTYQVLAAKETDEAKELHAGLSWDAHAAEWQPLDPAHPDDGRVTIVRRDVAGTVRTAAEAGINRPAPAFLAEGFAIPVQECVLVPIIPLVLPVPVPVCWKRERKDTIYTELNLTFDLFPASLDAFLDLRESAPNGPWAPAWGQAGALKLPPLVDADGDGLPFVADAADNDWDHDADGLSDLAETARKTDPNQPDADGDGLTDPAELARGTDPARPDSDNDGASDGQEVAGWSVVYGFGPGGAPLRTRLRGDPLVADGDGDGIPDGREMALGFGPAAKSDATALVYQTALVEPAAPIFYLPLDEPAGASAFAERARGETATCRAVPDGAAPATCPAAGHVGRFGNAAHFDGQGEHLRIARPAAVNQLSRNYTVSMWIKPEALDRTQSLLFMAGTGGGFGLSLESKRLVLTLSDGYRMWGEANALAAGRWNHLVVEMIDANPADPDFYTYFYVDGQILLDGQISGRHVPRPGLSGDLVVGAALDPATGAPRQPFEGLVDEVVLQDWVDAGNTGNPAALYGGGINLQDGAVRPGQDVVVEGQLENVLLSRTAYGTRFVDFPAGLTAQPDVTAPFRLPPRSTQPSVLRSRSPFRVAAEAASGTYPLRQGVGAAIATPPEAVWAPADATQIFRWPGSADFDGTSAIFSENSQPLDLNNRSFTLSVWIAPDPPGGDGRRRGVMGWNGGEADGFPYLQVEGTTVIFGFGTAGGSRSATSSVPLRPYGWNHVAVAYDNATKLAHFYVNGQAGTPRTMTAAPRHGPFPRFAIGRSSDRAKLTLGEVKLTCSGDGGEGEYDLYSRDSVPPVSQSFAGTASDDAPKVLATNVAFTVVGSATVQMCEDDDGVRFDCLSGRDEFLGGLTVSSNEPGRTGTAMWSTRPGKPACSQEWLEYPDTATVSYTFENTSLPFVGGIKDLRIFGSALSAAQVALVQGSSEVVADFRFDDIPGQRSFLDSAGYHQGTCGPAPATCPQTGGAGRRNTGLSFDGQDDFVRADQVATSAAEGGAVAVSAWFRPAGDLAGSGTVWSFHDAAANNRAMLQARREAGGTFAISYYDDGVGARTLFGGLPPDTWYHVVLSVGAAGEITAFLGYRLANGADMLQAATPIGSTRAAAFPTAGGRFSLGQEWDGAATSNFFKGEIDEVRVLRQVQDDLLADLLYYEPPLARVPFDGPYVGLGVQHDEGIVNDVEGQMGQAGAFDGADSRLTIRVPARANGFFTFAAWLRVDTPTAAGDPAVRPIYHGRGNDLGGGLVFGKNGDVAFYLDGGVPTLTTCSGDGQRHSKVAATGTIIPPNVWTHVLVTGSDTGPAIYVNGGRVATQGEFRSPGNLEVIDIGASFLPPAATPCADRGRQYQHFSGRIDEVEIYNHALSPEEISTQFNLQNAWIDEVRTDPVRVDRDAPTADLSLGDPYLPLAPTALLAKAADATTRVVKVELGVNGASWAGAPEVLDVGAEPGTAWMPTFTPLAGGPHTLQLRAIDAVGNRGPASAPRTVYVDEQPPAISIAIEADLTQPIRLRSRPSADAQWILPIKGTVSDPKILGTLVDGSGVARMSLSLVDAASGEVLPIAPHQTPRFGGGAFDLDYILYADDPSGEYIVRAEAADRVGNVAQYESPKRVKVDNTAPQSRVVGAQVPSRPLVGGMNGLVARPIRPSSADQDPPPFLPDLLDAGSLLQGWVSDRPAGEVERPDVAGAEGVDVAFTPTFPHTAPFDHRALPGNVLLYLPLDERPSGGDQAFRDLVAERTAACAGARCPESGVASRNAQALRFDGQDDGLTLAHDPAIGALVSDYTLAAWILPESLEGIGRIVSSPRTDNVDGFSFGRSGSGLRLTHWVIQDYDTRQGILRAGVWQHVAVHVTADHDAEFYVNGVLVETVPGDQAASPDLDSPLLVGTASQDAADADRQSFAGAIDEVVIARGRIAPADWDLVFGMGPTAHLPFDDRRFLPWEPVADVGGMGAAGSFLSVLPDPAAGRHDGPGIVGAGALELTPDSGGVYLSPPPGVLPRGGDAFTLALWLRDMDRGRLRYGENAIAFAPGELLHTLGSEAIGVAVGDSGGWHHLAFVWDETARELRTFVDGQRVQQRAVAGGSGLGAENTFLHLGLLEGSPGFGVDDLRVYKRPLPDLEVAALAQARWQPVPELDPRRGEWFSRVPGGLEGFYGVSARGRDRLGNVDPEPKAAWRGYVDSLAPRVLAFGSTPGAGGIRHQLVVEDFGLDPSPAGLSLPAACTPASTTVTWTPVGAPWYRSLLQLPIPPERAGAAAGARDRAYRVAVDCQAAWARRGDRFRVCDIAANCIDQTYDGPDVGSPPPTATPGPSPTPAPTLTRTPPPGATTAVPSSTATRTRTPPPGTTTAVATSPATPTRTPTPHATTAMPTTAVPTATGTQGPPSFVISLPMLSLQDVRP